MNKAIAVTVERVMDEINSIPFESWPSREIQCIACELVESLQFEYNSHSRLAAMISAQCRLSKAIADACQSERSNMLSCASRPIYYATGKALLDSDAPMLAEHLKNAGDLMEESRRA